MRLSHLRIPIKAQRKSQLNKTAFVVAEKQRKQWKLKQLEKINVNKKAQKTNCVRKVKAFSFSFQEQRETPA